MRIFDLTHAYQPFQPPDFIPPWVEKNLVEIFLPLSRAMKEGVIRRGLQLQGWTIEAFLESPEPIRSLAEEFLGNLRKAHGAGHIQLGFSGYSHPILPLLSDNVLVRSIKEDYVVVRKYLGEPTWFWFPEGCCDKRSLKLLFREFPDVFAVIPDGCVGRSNFSGFFKLQEGGRVVVFNAVLKDIFLNAFLYKGLQPFAPQNLSWKDAENMMIDSKALLRALPCFTEDGFVVLARDLEQYSRKHGFIEFEEGFKEQKAFYEGKEAIDFALVESVNFTGTLSLEDVKSSSWEPLATKRDPYPYWKLPSWVEFVNAFCGAYNEDFSKESLVVLASDIPWHLSARKEWGPYPPHAYDFTSKVIVPIAKRIGSATLIRATQRLHQELERYVKKNHEA